MTLCALLLSMAGATLTYLASTQQKLLSAPLRPHTHLVAMAIAIGGVVAWLEAAGTGAGIAATASACIAAESSLGAAEGCGRLA